MVFFLPNAATQSAIYNKRSIQEGGIFTLSSSLVSATKIAPKLLLAYWDKRHEQFGVGKPGERERRV